MTATITRPELKVLAITQGQWGERIADHVGRYHPPDWTVHHWKAPHLLPLIIDDPADFLPATLPASNLILALGEKPSLAQLIPGVVEATGARAVIAPIDRTESLPPGLARQLQGWLTDLGATVVFPKPFCSLTEATYNFPPIRTPYDDPLIHAFAREFGTPRLQVLVEDQHIFGVTVERGSACGCADFVAQGLLHCPVAEAEHQAGMLHHHYPCLASMNQDPDYKDTLMHVSGYALRAAVKAQVQAHLEPTPYWQPLGRVDESNQ